METSLQFVRKKDFKLSVGFDPDDADRAKELEDAIFRVRPSFLAPRLFIEIYQPLLGSVHETIMMMCEEGIAVCSITTLIPTRPDLVARAGDIGHIRYHYEKGKVIDQETPMSREDVDGDEVMVHKLYLEFEDAKIATNEWVRPTVAKPNGIVRPFRVYTGGVELNC